MHIAINKFTYLELRLCIAIIVSILFIISDGVLNMFASSKHYVEDSIYLFYHLCNRSIYMFDYMSKIMSGYTKLMLENNSLRKELFLKNSELLILDHYKKENHILNNLLNAPIYQVHSKLITQVFFVCKDTDEQAIINKGSNNGVYIGQPVISDVGVVGQIITVNNISSRILLISDQSHALPVKIKRTNSRMILVGRGPQLDMYAEFYGDTDIHVNDILVTSGLDNRFPEGYPVATISNIKNNIENDLMIIQAKPIVNFKRLCYVILICK